MQNSGPSKLHHAVLQLLFIIGSVLVLYYGSDVLLPLTVGGLLAMLLHPIHEKLKSWGLSSGLSIAGAMLLLLLCFAGLFAAIGQQAASFSEDWPETRKKIATQLTELRQEYKLGAIIPEIERTGSDSGSTISQLPISRSGIMSFFSGTMGILGNFMLMLVYVVLLLSQKSRLREFILRLMPDDKRGETHRTLNESTGIVQKYLRGRLILIAILSVLYSLGFLIIGLDYPILIAMLVAVLSIIPYLGNIIGGTFAIALAFAGDGGSTAIIGVLITMGVAQVLESYILLPLIVGDEVDINPLTTIVCVVGMTILWGPVGAIIAIPVFAILRIVCKHVPELENYAYLMGQE